MLDISQLEARLRALPSYQTAETTVIKRLCVSLMVAKFGPKVATIHRATGYEPQFIADAINHLQAGNKLLTGVLERAYLKPYFKDDLALLDEVLDGETDSKRAEPVKAATRPAAPAESKPKAAQAREAILALCETTQGSGFGLSEVYAHLGGAVPKNDISFELRAQARKGVIKQIAAGGPGRPALYVKADGKAGNGKRRHPTPKTQTDLPPLQLSRQ